MNPANPELSGLIQAASVHVELFDLQHRHFFGLMHRLETEMTGARGRDRMHEFLLDLADYAIEHIATEEAVLRAYGYPDLESHMEEHRKLCQMIADFKEREVDGDPALSVSVLLGLRGWFLSHVRGTDNRYAEYLNARGMR